MSMHFTGFKDVTAFRMVCDSINVIIAYVYRT